MDQVTDVFGLPVTVAMNCRPWSAKSVAFNGLTPTLTLAVGVS